MATRRPSAVATRASEIPPATADRPVAFWAAMPLKALMMPTTVPNRPTKGAVEPMVARPERPRFISAWTMATERSRPRLAASMTSASETLAEADWNFERPVATTLPMWDFLLRSGMEMASSILPSRSAPATCWTKMRDCLRAALYISMRSIMTPTDQADITKSRMTTIFAGIPMVPHILRMSQPTYCSCCNSQRLMSERVASIQLAPFGSLATVRPGPRHGEQLPGPRPDIYKVPREKGRGPIHHPE